MLFQRKIGSGPKPEVEYLMKLPEEFLGTFLPELIEENVRVEMIGDFSAHSCPYTTSCTKSNG